MTRIETTLGLTKQQAIDLLDHGSRERILAERSTVNYCTQQLNERRISKRNNISDVVVDQGALAHSLYYLNHPPTYATKEYFRGLFITIQLDGRPNDVMIGDQRHDVCHLMTSSSADRRISNNCLRMTIMWKIQHPTTIIMSLQTTNGMVN